MVQLHNAVPAFLALVIAQEALDRACVIPGLYIYGSLDAVTGANLGKAGQDLVVIG